MRRETRLAHQLVADRKVGGVELAGRIDVNPMPQGGVLRFGIEPRLTSGTASDVVAHLRLRWEVGSSSASQLRSVSIDMQSGMVINRTHKAPAGSHRSRCDLPTRPKTHHSVYLQGASKASSQQNPSAISSTSAESRFKTRDLAV